MACGAVHKLFLRLGEENEWEGKYVDHKRGKSWAAVNMGMAYGFGNDPYNQANDGHEKVVDELLSSPELRRIAIHQSGAFSCCLHCNKVKLPALRVIEVLCAWRIRLLPQAHKAVPRSAYPPQDQLDWLGLLVSCLQSWASSRDVPPSRLYEPPFRILRHPRLR